MGGESTKVKYRRNGTDGRKNLREVRNNGQAEVKEKDTRAKRWDATGPRSKKKLCTSA